MGGKPLALAGAVYRSVSNPYRSNGSSALAVLTITDPVRLEVGKSRQRNYFQPERAAIFERNVRNFVCVARGHGVTPIVSAIVCSPKAGSIGQVVERLNESVRSIATSLSVACADLAREGQWKAEAFLDDHRLRDCPDGLERKGRLMADCLIRQHIIDHLATKAAVRR